MRNYVGNLKTIFFKTAWYYVNLYTGDTTWKRPIKQAPGSPRLMPDGLICCELVDEVPLDTLAQPYSALSYCAGSPEDTRPILVNGYMFNAFANLEHSIDCLRQRPVKNTNLPLLLWTDQVCINQSDNQEKAHQVGFMRQIYEQAEEVLIVLSTADTSTFALTTAPQGAEAMEHCHRMTQMALPNDSGGTELKERYQTELMHQFTKETTEQSTKYEENTLISLLQQIAGSPWWTRAWVCFGSPARGFLS
jgi:hypothetical protein